MYGLGRKVANENANGNIDDNGISKNKDNLFTTNKEKEDLVKETSFYKNAPQETQNDFMQDLQKVDETHLKLLNKFAKEMEVEYNSQGRNSYYSQSTNKIYLGGGGIATPDERDKALNAKTGIVKFLHESGHWLDYNALGNGKTIRKSLPDLRKKLLADAASYATKLCNDAASSNELFKLEQPLKTKKDLLKLPYECKMLIYNDLTSNEHMKNGVSDIWSGLTNCKIYGRYYHENPYWKGDNLEKETIAQFFEARGNAGEKLAILKKYFPSAYDYFDDFVKNNLEDKL